MVQRIDPLILGEAADWLVQLQSGTATEADHRAVQAWCKRSAQHGCWQHRQPGWPGAKRRGSNGPPMRIQRSANNAR